MTTKNISSHTGKSGELQYFVGPYKDVRKIEGIEGMDAHHAGQGAVMKRLVENYDYKTAPAITVPRKGHTEILDGMGVVSRSTKGFENPRQLLARDIREMRKMYPDIPNSAYQNLIEMNKKMYKEVRK